MTFSSVLLLFPFVRARPTAALVVMVVALGFSRPASAAGADSSAVVDPHLTFTFIKDDPAAAPMPVPLTWSLAVEGTSVSTPAQRPVAVEYSDAYRVRARIHRIASIAALPLFAAEGFVGQSLYANPSSARRSAHLALAAGIGGLFAVNAVTGVWNLVEARKDPNGRGRRMLHGVLMLAADAGFLATAALGPGDGEDGQRVERGRGSASAHRAMAFTSLGLATAGYLVMLFGGR
jgi:hypothetical protein